MNELEQILSRLDRIETKLTEIAEQKPAKEFYSTAEIANTLGRAEFTVREWCRLKRINCSRRDAGRGPHGEWKISHDELTRIQNEGLLPIPDRF